MSKTYLESLRTLLLPLLLMNGDVNVKRIFLTTVTLTSKQLNLRQGRLAFTACAALLIREVLCPIGFSLMTNTFEWCRSLSRIAFTTIASSNMSPHSESERFVVTTADFFSYLLAMSWKRRFASSPSIGRYPTSSNRIDVSVSVFGEKILAVLMFSFFGSS